MVERRRHTNPHPTPPPNPLSNPLLLNEFPCFCFCFCPPTRWQQPKVTFRVGAQSTGGGGGEPQQWLKPSTDLPSSSDHHSSCWPTQDKAQHQSYFDFTVWYSWKDRLAIAIRATYHLIFSTCHKGYKSDGYSLNSSQLNMLVHMWQLGELAFCMVAHKILRVIVCQSINL